MIMLGTMNAVVAIYVGLITAIVSWRVLRKAVGVNNPVLGICVGILTGIGLTSYEGGTMSAILIPYEALGIAIVVMLFLMLLFKGKKGKGMKIFPPESRDMHAMPSDPWEKEIRSGGKLADRFGSRKRK